MFEPKNVALAWARWTPRPECELSPAANTRDKRLRYLPLEANPTPMKNAHERFGTLLYRRRTEKTATNIRVSLEAFVGEESSKAHMVSVVGGDVEIGALAAECSLGDDQRRYVIQTLMHDGYINNIDDPGTYRFNSPLLQLWWLRNVASM